MQIDQEYEVMYLDWNYFANPVALEVLPIANHKSKLCGRSKRKAQLRSQGFLDKVVGATPIN